MLTKTKLNEAAVSEQPLDEEERELLKTVYERLDIFEEANRPYHDKAKESREIMRLRDPGQDGPGTKEKTLQLQTLKSTINNSVADQMTNLPEAKLLPETPELDQMAMDLQDMIHYICYTLNDYQAIHRRRAEDLYVTGTSIMQVAWDPDMADGNGDIALIRWPMESFLWDPTAENVQDARAVIKISWHPMSWYWAHYPDEAPYVAADEGTHNEVGMPSSQKGLNGSDEDRAMMLEYWYREYDRQKRRYTINVAYCAGGAMLEHHEDVYGHGLYPFIVDVHSTVEGSMAGEGLVQELVPMQRYINRYAKYIDVNLRMSAKGRMLVRKNSGIDRNALADWSQDMIEGDSIVAGEDWAWMQHAPLNGMISQQMLQMQSDMKQDSGMNQFSRGETTGGVVSGKAVAALQQAGGKVTGMRTDTLNIGFKRMTEQILWLISEFYDEDRMLYITGRDGSSRQIVIKPDVYFDRKDNGVNPPPYLVQIEVMKKDPVSLETQNEMYMQAYTMAAQAQQNFPLSALFRLMNIEGKDRLLPVIEQNEQQMQQMMQLQQENEQLQQQMAQLQQDNENLKATTMQMVNSMSKIGAMPGGGMMADPGAKMGSASAMSPTQAMAGQARGAFNQTPPAPTSYEE